MENMVKHDKENLMYPARSNISSKQTTRKEEKRKNTKLELAGDNYAIINVNIEK